MLKPIPFLGYIHIFVCVYYLFVMEIWPGSLVVRKCFMYYSDLLGSSGNCNLDDNCVFGMVNSSYISVTLYFVILFAIFYHEILVNLQISTLFLQISPLYIVKSVDFSIKSSIFVIFQLKSSVLSAKCFGLHCYLLFSRGQR